MSVRSLIFQVAGVMTLSVALIPNADATSCNMGPYIVFFDEGEAYIDEKGKKILDHVSHAAGNCGYGKTVLAGHTDRSEESPLSLKRLNTVRAYLAAHGIPAEDIEMTSFGSTEPRVAQRSDQPEPQNRRVEIIFSQRRALAPE